MAIFRVECVEVLNKSKGGGISARIGESAARETVDIRARASLSKGDRPSRSIVYFWNPEVTRYKIGLN